MQMTQLRIAVIAIIMQLRKRLLLIVEGAEYACTTI